jgi:hypothetical protein
MKTISEITRIIENGLNSQLESVLGNSFSQYHIVICPERVFDKTVEERQENPDDQKEAKTIYFVIKFGKGQQNFAVINMQVSIEVLSEQGRMDGAQQILRGYAESVNFEYSDGIIQTYFSPEVIEASSDIYDGYRSLVAMSGNIKIVNASPLTLIVTNVKFGDKDSTPSDIPFISISLNQTSTPDPQVFPELVSSNGEYSMTGGSTKSLNKQTTRTFGLTTYLFDFGESLSTGGLTDSMARATVFSRKIIKHCNGSAMNEKYHFILVTNIPDRDTSGDIINGSYLPLIDGWFVVTGIQYIQDLGNTSTISISFAEAKETEND